MAVSVALLSVHTTSGPYEHALRDDTGSPITTYTRLRVTCTRIGKVAGEEHLLAEE